MQIGAWDEDLRGRPCADAEPCRWRAGLEGEDRCSYRSGVLTDGGPRPNSLPPIAEPEDHSSSGARALKGTASRTARTVRSTVTSLPPAGEKPIPSPWIHRVALLVPSGGESRSE